MTTTATAPAATAARVPAPRVPGSALALAALLAPYRGAVLARPRPTDTTLRDRLRAARIIAATK